MMVKPQPVVVLLFLGDMDLAKHFKSILNLLKGGF